MMENTAFDILRAVFGAFCGTVGFAVLMHVPKKSWLPSGLIAAGSYLIYVLLTRAGLSEPAGIFMGAVFGSMTGQICARKMKIIGTVFLMSAIVPVVPGLGLYRMMAFLGQGRTADGAELGIQAMITIAMIALGMGVGSYIDRLIVHRVLKKRNGLRM